MTGYVGIAAVQLLGNLAPTWTSKEPSPFASQYTMTLTNENSNSLAIGDSYGALTVSKEGVLSVAGQLADGNAFSQSVPISEDGMWPFYAYVSQGQDFLLGWVSFASSPITGPVLEPTNIVWSKGANSKGRYYPAGFTSPFNLTGSVYAYSRANGPVLTLVNPEVVLSGGGLGAPQTYLLDSKNDLVYSTTNLTLSINPEAGTFSGRLHHQGEELSLKLNGIVLQNQESGFGFFLGTNEESGVVLFQSQ